MRRMLRLAVLLAAVLLATHDTAWAARKQQRSRSILVGRLLAIDICRDKTLHITNFNATLRQIGEGGGGSVSVDMDYTVTKTAKTFSKFEMVLIKCQEAVSSNTCEYYQTWSYGLGVCDIIAAPMMPWSSGMQSMRPPFKCPFLKGPYVTRNATANLEPIKHIPIPWEGSIWRATVIFYNELKEVHLCWTADVDFKRVKVN